MQLTQSPLVTLILLAACTAQLAAGYSTDSYAGRSDLYERSFEESSDSMHDSFFERDMGVFDGSAMPYDIYERNFDGPEESFAYELYARAPDSTVPAYNSELYERSFADELDLNALRSRGWGSKRRTEAKAAKVAQLLAKAKDHREVGNMAHIKAHETRQALYHHNARGESMFRSDSVSDKEMERHHQKTHRLNKTIQEAEEARDRNWRLADDFQRQAERAGR